MADLSMLSEMMGTDLEQSIAQLKALGIHYLDLKNQVFGHAIEQLDPAGASQLADLLARTGMQVSCFASVLGYQPIDVLSEGAFRAHLLQGVEQLLATAHVARPRLIRLLACRFATPVPDGAQHLRLEREFPWVYTAYRDAIALCASAGIPVTIENEPNSVLASPTETLGFFARLDVGVHARYTWDIQNMWESGIFPTLAVYAQLKPIINSVHLKGGRGHSDAPTRFTYRSNLEHASWPVQEIIGQVLKDGTSPVLCLNTSHGPLPPTAAGAPYEVTFELTAEEARQDVAFLRHTFPEEL